MAPTETPVALPTRTQVLTEENLLKQFPRYIGRPNKSQREAFEKIARQASSLLLEAPTGTGKTAIGFTVLMALVKAGYSGLWYVVPNKALVDQVAALHPEVTRVYGRNEYPCLYFEGQDLSADDIPCLSIECPHRVDMETGETVDPDATPCPYYLAKYHAKTSSSIVVCTMSFYLFNTLFSRGSEPASALVIDEVHRLPDVVRGALSYDISDYHLERSIALLEAVEEDEAAGVLKEFYRQMKRILAARKRSNNPLQILSPEEIDNLLTVLYQIDAGKLQASATKAIRRALASADEEGLKTLKQLQTIAYDLTRYVRSFEYAQSTEEHEPLNYVTYAYRTDELVGNEKVRQKLVIRNYYVVPRIRRILAPFTLAYSATIGDPKIFGYESGIQSRFLSLLNTFPEQNTRLYLPIDAPQLAAAKRDVDEPRPTLRRIAKMCSKHAGKGLRSLVIVVSEEERTMFLEEAKRAKLSVVSYGEGVTARAAAAVFRDGKGDVLVGTTAQYGEGLDLPDGMAPVIHLLRPGYPNPREPQAQFEVQRFGKTKKRRQGRERKDPPWWLWQYREVIKALQARGRNVRSARDRGVTIFWSASFGNFLPGGLPDWLKPSWRRRHIDEIEDEIVEFLG